MRDAPDAQNSELEARPLRGEPRECRIDRGAPLPTDEQLREAARCPRCTIWNKARLALPETCVDATTAKMTDAKAGIATTVTLLSTGEVAVEADLVAKERAARFERYGHLTAEFARALPALNPKRPVKIWIWANAEVTFPPKEEIVEAPERAAEGRRQIEARVAEAVNPIVAWLNERRLPVLESGNSPLIRAEVGVSDLPALNELPTVGLIGSDEWPGTPTSTAWYSAARIAGARAYSPGDVPFCVLEGEQPNDYTNLLVAQTAAPGGPSTFHMTATMAIIRSRLWNSVTNSGPAYVANWNGYVGTPSEPSVQQWCMNRGVYAINFSWSFSAGAPGGLSGSDMQQDFLTKVYPYPLFVNAAGNGGANAGSDTVQNRSFNTLVVGASDDVGTGSIVDDKIAWFSSWRNPTSPHGDRELPQLVAPGVNVDGPGYSGMSGTSIAAPIVTGATLIADRTDPASMRFWPELQRAVAIASAPFNVDGAAITRLPAADSRDGGGLLNAETAAFLSLPGLWKPPGSAFSHAGRDRRTLWMHSAFDANGYGVHAWNLEANVAGRMRVVIAFDATSNCGAGLPCTTDTLDADLDLFVDDASGRRVCSSMTFDESWEICDFPVQPGQRFTARLKRWAVNHPSTYFGIAWINYKDTTAG